MRVTLKDLESRLRYLNELTGNPTTYSDTQPPEKIKTNIGHYHLGAAYGGICLHQVCTEDGGVTTPLYTGYITKTKMYDLINAYISGICDQVDRGNNV